MRFRTPTTVATCRSTIPGGSDLRYVPPAAFHTPTTDSSSDRLPALFTDGGRDTPRACFSFCYHRPPLRRLQAVEVASSPQGGLRKTQARRFRDRLAWCGSRVVSRCQLWRRVSSAHRSIGQLSPTGAST
jgi:hypothetical protein